MLQGKNKDHHCHLNTEDEKEINVLLCYKCKIFMYENMTTTEPWFICWWLLTGEYVAVLRKCPEDPLVNLCIGLTFIHLAGQKFSSKKHSLFTQVSHALTQRFFGENNCP